MVDLTETVAYVTIVKGVEHTISLVVTTRFHLTHEWSSEYPENDINKLSKAEDEWHQLAHWPKVVHSDDAIPFYGHLTARDTHRQHSD
jgi:hypothetical protein